MKMTNGNSLKASTQDNVEQLISTLKGKKVTIIGHDNIDVDAALSGILLSKLLDFLKIENQFLIIDKVEENETYKIIKELTGRDLKKYQGKEEENRVLFLVDHYETKHLGSVIGIIDHHKNNQGLNYKFVHEKASSATAYIIYQMMKEVNFPISKEEVNEIIISMMVDTISFKSSKAIKAEKQEAKRLAAEYEISYEELEKKCLCLTPIETFSIEQIIQNGQKWYDYKGKKVGSSYVQLYEIPERQKIQEWLNALKAKREKTCSDMLVFIMTLIKDNITYEYQITNECIKETAKKGLLSRGKDIMPLIEQRYSKQKDAEEKMEEIVKKLAENKQTIVTMESCTGGAVASEITNVSGASSVLKESYVTYCNEAKIRQGVPKKTIEKYTVYSAQTAKKMAKAARKSAKANIGIGVTGQLGRIDPNNPVFELNNVWFAINNNDNVTVCKLYISEKLKRSEQKKIVIREIVENLYQSDVKNNSNNKNASIEKN